jgi:amino acid transporter
MAENKKSFKLFDAILSVICVVFVAEAAAPAAAIGNSQYFWWIFLIVTFLLPYGLIAAELGTTYEDEGGLYDWVKRAYGQKWGSRVAWYYWVNFPLWMASLAVIFPEVIQMISGYEMSVLSAVAVELAFIWIVVFISFFRVSDSKWILNLSAIFKVFIALVLGGLGLYVAFTQGMATEFTLGSMLPSTDLTSLAFVSVILFNFMGFEVVTTFASDMENPESRSLRLLSPAVSRLQHCIFSHPLELVLPFRQMKLILPTA